MLQLTDWEAESWPMPIEMEHPAMVENVFATAEEEAAHAIGLLPRARLGVLLHGRRKHANVKLSVAARTAGIEKTALREIESGSSVPDVSVLASLLECYGVPLGEFVPPRRPLVLPNPDATSAEILSSYVDAVRKWREAGRKQRLNFRADDLRTLSTLLGTDPDEIERRLIALTGCSRAEARVLRKWFLAALIMIPLAVTTAGVIGPAAASAATPHSVSAATHHRAASASASASASAASRKRHPSASKKHHVPTSKTHKLAAPVAPSNTAAARSGAATASPASPSASTVATAATANPIASTVATASTANPITGTVATASTANPSASTALSPVGIPGAWNVALDSEFSGTSLDTSIWRPGWFGSGTTGPVDRTHEAACYSPNNVTFPGDGSVHLKVTGSPSSCNGVTEPYTGSLISSNPHDGRASGGFEYTYGALEARVYIPAASGNQVANWPAVWTDGQSWPTTGEDDLMEGLSGGQACFHFHSTAGGPGTCVAGAYTGWHTFASDWEPGSVTYYYDGVKVGQITTGITASPMYIVLDNTVASANPALSKAADLQVAYVRVWQH
jgi:beta-glucanase (GH16 family)/transcriptional regulator with XRE-family HTH domain